MTIYLINEEIKAVLLIESTQNVTDILDFYEREADYFENLTIWYSDELEVVSVVDTPSVWYYVPKQGAIFGVSPAMSDLMLCDVDGFFLMTSYKQIPTRSKVEGKSEYTLFSDDTDKTLTLNLTELEGKALLEIDKFCENSLEWVEKG